MSSLRCNNVLCRGKIPLTIIVIKIFESGNFRDCQVNPQKTVPQKLPSIGIMALVSDATVVAV